MPVKSNPADNSNELKVYRFNNGIKLIHPEKLPENKNLKICCDVGHSLSSILGMPFPVSLETTDSVSISCNELHAEACNFSSAKDAIGKKWYQSFQPKTVIQSINNDKKVMQNNFYQIAEEKALHNNKFEFNCLSIRMPWYNDDNKVNGLFVCSIILGKNSLDESLSHMAKLGILSSSYQRSSTPSPLPTDFSDYQKNYLTNEFKLSKRELICLELYVYGKTAKEISRILYLSNRTIENYIQSVKNKMQAPRKTDLIHKTLALSCRL